MPYHDLNIAYSNDARALNHALSFAEELGYSTIALATTITGKLPSAPPTLDLRSVRDGHPSLTLLTRLTLPISDPSQNHRLSQFSSAFSLLALRPLNEKALQLACTSLDCDIISLDFTTRLPFILKFKTLSAALQRGIRFEISYSPSLVSGSDAKRNLIAGSTSLIRATRGRGIIISSEAKTALGLRGPLDVLNLCQIWGLEQARGKEAVCEEPGKVVRLAELKRQSYRGVITVVDGGGRSTANTGSISTEAAKLPAQVAEAATSNGVKRKASTSSLAPHGQSEATSTAVTPSSAGTPVDEDGKPLSKREQKRRAKKVRLKGYLGKDSGLDGSGSQVDGQARVGEEAKFPLRHESLGGGKGAKQKQNHGQPIGQHKKKKGS